MWFLMSIAMMSPTIIPTLNTYNDILESGGKKENSFLLFFVCFFSFLDIQKTYKKRIRNKPEKLLKNRIEKIFVFLH